MKKRIEGGGAESVKHGFFLKNFFKNNNLLPAYAFWVSNLLNQLRNPSLVGMGNLFVHPNFVVRFNLSNAQRNRKS